MSEKKSWEKYEEVAAYLLDQFANEFGLSQVEGKQKILGLQSTTEWEIDAKGVCIDGEGIIIVECRRHTKRRQSQESLAGLAYRIIDTDAHGGIMISPLGIQEGAAKVASAKNIIEVKLQQDSTPRDFAMSFLGKVMHGVSIQGEIRLGGTVTAEVLRKCRSCGKTFVASADERQCLDCIGK